MSCSHIVCLVGVLTMYDSGMSMTTTVDAQVFAPNFTTCNTSILFPATHALSYTLHALSHKRPALACPGDVRTNNKHVAGHTGLPVIDVLCHA
jgi:hypothetical protein